jgi:tetratricopeptide (TPR) repeat protein
MEITQLRSRLELLRGNTTAAIAFAREALALCTESQKMEQGISAHALADALAGTGDVNEASTTYEQAVDLLEATGQWRPASAAARSWGRLLREQGRESEALDVLDRAAELGTRATPEGVRAER